MFNFFKIDTAYLKQACTVASFCRETDPEASRMPLQGTLFELDADRGVNIVNTNGRMLGFTEAPIDNVHGLNGESILVDLDPLYKQRGKIPKRGSRATVIWHDDHLTFVWSKKDLEFEADCPIIEGKFPNWRQVVPSQANRELYTLDPAAWLEKWNTFVERVTWDAVNLRFGGKHCVSSHRFDEYNFPEFELKNDNETPASVQLNLALLMPILKAATKAEVRIYWEKPESPLLIETGITTFVLMPMGDI